MRFSTSSFSLNISNMTSSEENRLELTLASIYQKDIKSLMSAIRAPRAKDGDKRGAQIREQVQDIRNEFKSKLLEIVKGLKELLHAQIDYAAFQAIMDAPKDKLEAYLDNTAREVDAVDIRTDLETRDEVAIPPPAPVPNMYS